MKTAAFTLGLIAGVIGVIAGVVELAAIGAAVAIVGDGDIHVLLGVATLIAAAIGIVGASLSGNRPGWAGAYMLVATAVGVISAAYLWIPSAVLFLAAVVCAWLSRAEMEPGR